MKSSGVDNHAARELELYIDNDSDLYRQKDAFLANVHRKMKSGKYSPTEAPKLWMYYVDRGAKAYAKEFGSASEWNRMFNRATRQHLAERYAREEHAMIQRGEYSKYPPVQSGESRNSASRDRRRALSSRRVSPRRRMSRDINAAKIKTALAYVHHNERKDGRANAARYAVRTHGLNSQEAEILYNALHLTQAERRR